MWRLQACNAIVFRMIGFILILPQMTLSEGCIEDPDINESFELYGNGKFQSTIPRYGSCCMYDVCGLACPEYVPPPDQGFGTATALAIAAFFVTGASVYYLIGGSAENYFVAGRSLPLFTVAITLGAQAIDSNSILGNVDNSYKYSFWDGAVLPIGLSLSLIINGLFLASKINEEHILTLPDVFARRYGATVEILASLATVISFMMLLAGNLVGIGVLLAYVWGIGESGAIWISSSIVWSYTATGGLFSVAYTDMFQSAVGWTGCIVLAVWLISNSNDHAPPPSIGYPGYIYPDLAGSGGICDMYDGVPCKFNTTQCCYNEQLWCPQGSPRCDRYDRGAYPYGDKMIYPNQMTDFLALAPFPNALAWNWATIVILALGNVAALDFQARCMASKSPRNASIGCLIGAVVVIVVGVPFSFLGSITRTYYGPDAATSMFEADSCSVALGLPTCGRWVPDKIAFLKLLTHDVPPFLGGWCLIGIVSASMSTADGAILALGTVVSNNILRHLDPWYPEIVTSENLLLVARMSTLPLTIISTILAAYYRSNDDHAAGSTGSLLIIAFDISFATVVVPLFGAFYVKTPSPRAALISILSGAIARIVLQFQLDKDGSLLLPYNDETFLDYGTAASTKQPSFLDANETNKWDPELEPCEQTLNSDYTGIDSLCAFLISAICFIFVQTMEYRIGKPLFSFYGDVGYEKDGKDDDGDDDIRGGSVVGGEGGQEEETRHFGYDADYQVPAVTEILFILSEMVLLCFTIIIVLWINALS